MGSEIIHMPRTDVVRAEDFMPVFTVEQAVERKAQMNQFISKVLVDGEDYGKMPGGQQKKVLMKPGAEKLCSIFGLAPRYVAEQTTESWVGLEFDGEPFFYYRYKCQLYRGDRFMGEAVGSCNSWEAKYRYRWMSEDQLPEGLDKENFPKRGGRKTLFEFLFAFDKRETTGQYGKPEEHWQMFEKAVADGKARRANRTTKKGEQTGWEIDVDTTLYRVPNPDSADTVNTCQKMAQKRALVAAVLVVTNCSDAFTQDLEDVETETVTRNTPAQQADLAEKRVAEEKEKTANGTPKDLKILLDGIDKDIARSGEAFRLMWDKLESLGGAGIAAYSRIHEAFGKKYPNGCTDKEELKRCISDLYHAIKAVEYQIAPKQAELMGDPV